MATMKELLGQGDMKKHRRNFLQENVRRLKEVKPAKENKLNSQSKKSVQPLSNRRNGQENTRKLASSPPPNSRFKSSLLSHRKPGTSMTKSSGIGEPRVENGIATPESTSKGYRNQAIQTLSGLQLETLYFEGVIRYPSARPIAESVSVREMGLQTESMVALQSPSPSKTPPKPPADTSPISTDVGLQKDEDLPSATGKKDVMKTYVTFPEHPRIIKTTDSKPDSNKADPNAVPPTYQRGVVPRYLKAHKKELEKERLSRAQAAVEECPEGHVLLPDDIRLSHLVTLKQKYMELVKELNKMPVSTDTLRTRNRKKEIEEELDKIEVAMTLFSREKVFVKANS